MKFASIAFAAIVSTVVATNNPNCTAEQTAKTLPVIQGAIPADCLSLVKADNITTVPQFAMYLRRNKTKAAALCTPGPCLTFVHSWSKLPECKTIVNNSTLLDLNDVHEHFDEDCEKLASNSTGANSTKPSNSTGSTSNSTKTSGNSTSAKPSNSTGTTAAPKASSASVMSIGAVALVVSAFAASN